MQKKYIPGINILGGAEYTVPEQMEMLKRVGWGGVFTGWDKTKTTEWALAADRLGLIYQSIHSPFRGVRHMWFAGDEGKRVTDELIDCVKDCHQNHIPVMVIHPFIGFEDHDPTEIGLENYARVVDVADRLGVRLGFENVEGEEYLAATTVARICSPFMAKSSATPISTIILAFTIPLARGKTIST